MSSFFICIFFCICIHAFVNSQCVFILVIQFDIKLQKEEDNIDEKKHILEERSFQFDNPVTHYKIRVYAISNSTIIEPPGCYPDETRMYYINYNIFKTIDININYRNFIM